MDLAFQDNVPKSLRGDPDLGMWDMTLMFPWLGI